MVTWHELAERQAAYKKALAEANHPPGMGVDARRTARRKAMIAAGVHPLMGTATRDDETCGSCAHILHNGRFLKCDRVPMTHGPGTDVRASWPACTQWEAKPDGD